MMKKVLLGLLAVLMVVSLIACNKGDNQNTEQTAETTETTTAANEAVIADAGKFTVKVPAGWFAYPQIDMFAEKDAEGKYPIDPFAYAMIKGGTSDIDSLAKPTVYVYYKDGFTAEEQADSTKMFYDQTADIDVTVGGKKCIAFEAKSESFSEDGTFYVYNIVFIPVGETSCVQVNIPVDMIEFEGVSVTDADVVEILESITVK